MDTLEEEFRGIAATTRLDHFDCISEFRHLPIITNLNQKIKKPHAAEGKDPKDMTETQIMFAIMQQQYEYQLNEMHESQPFTNK